ncbi:hypothetical protein [Wenxinia marina]|uniref:hypothetical protein n=1 Tax=Wenxinia marina TaxID=390641 RepID=UPI0003748B0D|nr:hypothetical protein [Wenxinia marina]
MRGSCAWTAVASAARVEELRLSTADTAALGTPAARETCRWDGPLPVGPRGHGAMMVRSILRMVYRRRVPRVGRSEHRRPP